jgi:DNA adenine methylase
MTAPTRPALRWYGGKWRIAPWVIAHLPAHDAYCEPYGGAASVLLRKPPAKIETWNDLHGRLVNFFRVLRDQPQDLIRLIELTPYARQEYEAARAPADNPLEDARRFYVLAIQGRVGGAGGLWNHGWRYQRDQTSRVGSEPDEFAATDHLYAIAGRLKHVQIEHGDALDVLARFDTPNTLHYVDPPYVQAARSDTEHKARYLHELTEDDHQDLAQALGSLQGMVVLSGYPSGLYDELYGGWRQVLRTANNDTGAEAVECLWLNPRARARAAQLSLLEGAS